MTKREIAEFIADVDLRRNFLYKAKVKSIDENGDEEEREIVRVITPNVVQAKLLNERHKRCIVPKARQHGITTAVCVWVILDGCLFNDHYKASIIAHREADALKIFASKIIFPYEQIPKFLKDAGFVPSVVRQTTALLELSNGSIITADTMVRSDTLQICLVSELAKMYMQFPHKAEEVKTGAIPATEQGQIFIESTMEGRYGLMPDLCNEALIAQREGRKLTKKDFKFFFFPWFDAPEYSMDEDYVISTRMRDYFESLYKEHGIELTEGQKKWYTAEEKIQGDKMKQEYPSTYEEAIEVTSDAYYYQRILNEIRQAGQVAKVPININLPTYTAWDLGYGDSTAIWIVQIQGIFVRVVGYVENSGEGLAWYVNWLKVFQEKHKITFEHNFLPHDVEVHELSTGISRKIKLEKLGVKCTVLPRLPIDDGVELVRELLPTCYFDAEACEVGLKMLDGYSKNVSPEGLISLTPRHDKTSHGADSFRYLATGLKKYGSNVSGRSTRAEIEARSKYYSR